MLEFFFKSIAFYYTSSAQDNVYRTGQIIIAPGAAVHRITHMMLIRPEAIIRITTPETIPTPARWTTSRPMGMDCMTCQVTCMIGAATGMARIRARH